MINLLRIVLCICLVFCFMNFALCEMSEADKKEIDKKTLQMYKKSCCPKDFLMLVLTKWEDCQGITNWQYDVGKEPHVLCRQYMFKKSGPCNDERRQKCTDRKDEWIECIKNAVEKENKGMKPEYANNEAKVAGIPSEKLMCYVNALESTKC